MPDYANDSVALHQKFGGKIEIALKVPLQTTYDLSVAYTPGVAQPCLEIQKNPALGRTLSWRKNLVAVVTDGSAVLGLGNIGGEAGMPVMEGKCALFKAFANVDAVPICLRTQDPDEIVSIVKNLEPSFGGINLEDIAAPKCFDIESRLKKELSIPVFHDDQHGTAVVTLAALTNALRLVKKDIKDVKIVFSGAGAAGIAVSKLLLSAGAKNIILCDSKGALSSHRDDLNASKKEIQSLTNPNDEGGKLKDVLQNADVFIGVSAPNLLDANDIRNMASDPVVLAMSNPTPEIMPDEAQKGGAHIIATGRSDFPNQVNNVLVFPGIFRGAFDSGATEITEKMLLSAASGLAGLVQNPTPKKFLPGVFDEGVSEAVAKAVRGK
ncbi:NADP-dependent malic enzyme [Candidatus Peregrinibacteria bacterium]|nr:MAG: NADP-dependent malic enzyme [Candidatus Peregrinibacteria bacterium]